MKTAVIVQARMGSRRFPGKVMANLCGRPVLDHVLERAEQIGEPVILAVPNTADNLQLQKLAARRLIPTHFSFEGDVLQRYQLAAREHAVDFIIRITADCPLLNVRLCKKLLNLYRIRNCDYAAIDWPRTYPKGYGCEIFSLAALNMADMGADAGHDREHVTPWITRNLKCEYLIQDKDESHLNYCVDEPGDIERLEKIMAENKT